METPNTLFLEKYCNITHEEALQRIQNTINKVKESHHVYRCIEKAMFATPRVNQHPYYPSLINHLHSLTVLELGCCFGTDARQLLMDGIPKNQLFVSDLHDAYYQIGQSILFKDELDINTQFMDFAVPRSQLMQFNVISCQMILHCLSKEQVECFLLNVLNSLLTNGVLFGCCVGTTSEIGVEWIKTPTIGLNRPEMNRFLHNRVTLSRLLESIGFKQIEVMEEILGSGDQEMTRLVFTAKKH
eukprot:NODE_119_length_18186_cov_1.929397.p9 type:complete len:243 gc:universal NODE_119_length_18186_cov_1.929397:6992-6264(-)